MYDKELVEELKKRNLTVFEEVYEIRMGISMKCTRRCEFCGISRLPTEDMTDSTFHKILDSATNRLRKICMSVYGESIMHSNVVYFIREFKRKFPKVQISTITNTDYFKKRGIELLFEMYDAGLNYIVADLYDDEQDTWFMNQLKSNVDKIDQRDIKVKDFYKSSDNIWGYHGPDKKAMYVVRDKDGPGSGGKVATRSFHTYGGNLDMKFWPEYVLNTKFPLMKVCGEPLKYLTITADGKVYMCCRDGGLSGQVGDVNEQGINDIWQGDRMHIIRKVLAEGRRDLMLPCILCNARTFRTGIYPYWGHKEYSDETIRETLIDVSIVSKEMTVYKNVQRLIEKGWEPNSIIKEVLNKIKGD